jgi:predicted Zn finger-like uncharacterized protein
MAESIIQQCPNCVARYEIGPPQFGRQIRCGKCGAVFHAALPPAPPPLPPAEEMEFPDFGTTFPKPNRTRSPRRNPFPLVVAVLAIGALATYLVGGKVTSAVSNQGLLDDKWTAEVRRHINREERDYKIVKVYPAESVRGAYWKYPRVVNVFFPVIDPDENPAAYEQLLQCTRAVRVEYETDEGFGREAYHDRIFVVAIAPNGRSIVRWVDEDNFRIGK